MFEEMRLFLSKAQKAKKGMWKPVRDSESRLRFLFGCSKVEDRGLLLRKSTLEHLELFM